MNLKKGETAAEASFERVHSAAVFLFGIAAKSSSIFAKKSGKTSFIPMKYHV